MQAQFCLPPSLPLRLLQHWDSSPARCHLWRDLPMSPSLFLLITIFITVSTVGVLRELITHFLGPVPYLPIAVLSRRSRRTCQRVWGGPSGMSHEVLWFWPLCPLWLKLGSVSLDRWAERMRPGTSLLPFTQSLRTLREGTSGPSLPPTPSFQGFHHHGTMFSWQLHHFTLWNFWSRTGDL